MIVTILQGIVDCTVLYIPSYPTVIDIAFSFLTSAQLVSMDLLFIRNGQDRLPKVAWDL